MARTEEEVAQEIQSVLASEYTCYRKHTLALSRSTLERVPVQLLKITFIHQLDLSDNCLTELPEEIGNMSALRSLKLRKNFLSTLPASIGNLKSLNMLDVSYNNLTQIPATIGKLVRLQYLHLNDNDLASLPKKILDLPARYMFLFNFNNNRFDTSLEADTTIYYVPSLLAITMSKVLDLEGPAVVNSPLLPCDLHESFTRSRNECETCGRKFYGCYVMERFYPTTIHGAKAILSSKRCGAGCTGTW